MSGDAASFIYSRAGTVSGQAAAPGELAASLPTIATVP
jgi:hypothetical protein